MFTGIVTDIGRIRSVSAGGEGRDVRFEIATAYDTSELAEGASICCAGVCLTVIARGPRWFAVETSAETLARTTLGEWRVDTPINLERALRAGDELGGHIVSGHVDGTAETLARQPEGGSIRFEILAPKVLARFIAAKGSVAIDGVSLTVNEVSDRPEGTAIFGVNVIAHTLAVTTLGALTPGRRVNLEVDTLARYVARLIQGS
ncbi:MAG TPA: riboflavin synthase [Alphaproteobacteria bacterium]|nr:riboflavin synthase [Alphaproteobacteria bacterium]